MRFLLLFLSTASVLLGACTKEPRPVRLDFIASSRFTSSNRTANPGDTLTARLFASDPDSLPLTRFQVSVTYEPTRNPLVYATQPTGTQNVPNDPTLVYDDVLLTNRRIKQLVYQTTFGTRTTSGNERWDFTITDKDNNKATRSFRLRIANRDSLADFHQYTLRVPAGSARPARPLLALLPGLAFPTSILGAAPANGQLIDVMFRASTTSLEVYQENPVTTRAELHTTTLDSTRFRNITTAAQLGAAFDVSQAGVVTTTGQLRRNQVVAFRTVDKHKGVLIVRRIFQTPYPMLELLVRVKKTPE